MAASTSDPESSAALDVTPSIYSGLERREDERCGQISVLVCSDHSSREESDNSLDVNTDNSEREEELQRFMDGEFIFIVERQLARQILYSQLSWRSQRVM